MPPIAELPGFSTPGRVSRRLLEGAALIAAMLAAGAISALLLRQDVNWDLRNYHFYNAWAFVHDRLGWDLAPAQSQTFHNPLLDLPFYWMVAADWRPRLIGFVMALPAGIGAFFLGRIVLLLFRELPASERWGYSILSFVIGVTASGPVSSLGSTMNDWPPAALIMIALWLILRRIERDSSDWHALVASGVLAGIATGFKLTNATFAIGLCVALLFHPSLSARALRDAVAFGIAVTGGLLLSSGAWMWTLYTHFESPLFPYFNDVFRSPWWDATRAADPRFGPHTPWGWLTFPLPLFGVSEMYVTEAPFRDWRLPLLYLALIAALPAWLFHRAHKRLVAIRWSRMWGFVITFWIISFLIWATMYAIYRYIIPLELLSGALLVFALGRIVPRGWLPAAAAICTALAIFTVRYPAWGRVDYGDHWFAVETPPIASHALVLLLDNQPLSVALPFFPSDGRFLGVNNNLNDPERRNGLEREIERLIREHAGPMYGLAAKSDAGAAALDAHGLRRVAESCAPVVIHKAVQALSLCRLERVGAHGQAGLR